MPSIEDPRIRQTLTRLHGNAEGEWPRVLGAVARSLGCCLRPHHLREAYISVSRQQGRLLYRLARANGARNIVEFGTSFGISAIYLGAAARDNGGRVVTTEIQRSKCCAAREHFHQAGLGDRITVLEGNALLTLAEHPGPIDLLFLDGWSDLYLELLNLLGPRLRNRAIIAAHNAYLPGVRAFLRRLRPIPGLSTTTVRTGGRAIALTRFIEPWHHVS